MNTSGKLRPTALLFAQAGLEVDQYEFRMPGQIYPLDADSSPHLSVRSTQHLRTLVLAFAGVVVLAASLYVAWMIPDGFAMSLPSAVLGGTCLGGALYSYYDSSPLYVVSARIVGRSRQLIVTKDKAKADAVLHALRSATEMADPTPAELSSALKGVAQKSETIALVLNLFSPGLGHIYATNGARWGIFAVNFVPMFFGILLLPIYVGAAILMLWFLPGTAIWLLALVQTSELVRSVNDKSLFSKVALDRRASRIRALEQHEQHEADAATLREKDRRASRADSSTIAAELAEIRTLSATGLLTATEAEDARQKLIAAADAQWTDQELHNFLQPITPLLQGGRLTPEDGQILKAIHGRLTKKHVSLTKEA